MHRERCQLSQTRGTHEDIVVTVGSINISVLTLKRDKATYFLNTVFSLIYRLIITRARPSNMS